MENIEEVVTDQTSARWFIDFGWYRQNNRSLSALTQRYLCGECQQRLGAGEAELSISDLMAAIRDCCSKTPEFITERLPILESVFRLILATGNQPIDLAELGEQLREQLGGDTYRTSPEILSRLLNNDQYYGLRQVTE